MCAGNPRRSAVGPEMRAQSSGEWPGVSTTCRDGFAGLLVCDGGGANDDAVEDAAGGRRFGAGEADKREDGELRWIELAAGN